jgi:hypothetical protein
VLVLAQWAKQSAANQLQDLEFHIGALMVMRLSPLSLKMEPLKFRLNGTVQDAVSQQVEIKINRHYL